MAIKIIDLTLELYEGLQTWYIHPKVVMIDYHQAFLNKDRYVKPYEGFSTKLLTVVDHVGTHVDAPAHVFRGASTIESISLDKVMGDALLVDVSFRDLNGPITPALLDQALKQTGEKVKEGDILIMRAWPHAWGAEGFHETRGMTAETVDWFFDHKFKMLATDLPTVDDSPDMRRLVHYRLLKEGVPIIENLINLDKIGRFRFNFIGLPLRIKGATGSPIRALALLD